MTPVRFSRFFAAGVAAVALVAASTMIPVDAAAAAVPSRISAWFSTQAIAVIHDTAAGATSLGGGRVDFAAAS